MSTAVLLWIVNLNLKVNDIVVPETLGDDRPVRSYHVYLVESPMLDQWQPCCSVLILAPKCIYEYVIRTTELIIRMKK